MIEDEVRASEPVSSTDSVQAETQATASLVRMTREAVLTSGPDASSGDCVTLNTDPRVRRAHRRQRHRRRKDQCLRQTRIAGACKLVAAGATWRRAAACLGVPERTLRHWRSQPCVSVKLRGRPVLATTVSERNEVFRFVNGVTGPMIGLPALRVLFPKMPRVVLTSMLTRYRRWWRNKHAVHGYRLT